MCLRPIVGWLLAGGLVFGFANCASGQVVLEAALEDVNSENLEPLNDRYGDYEPVSLTEVTGPILLSQIEESDLVQPPGQVPRSSVELGLPQSVPTLPANSVGPQFAPVQPAPGPMLYEVPQPMPMPRRSCPPWRPCGPQESFGGNWLVKQGFAGADFRGACDFHDRCLLSGCTDRKTCDKMFLAYLDNACNCSAFPILCRIKAREMYLGVRLFGWLY